MSKKGMVFSPRRDGRERTKREKQTIAKGRNYLARKYYEGRGERKKEMARLRRDNRKLTKNNGKLQLMLNELAHENAELRKSR